MFRAIEDGRHNSIAGQNAEVMVVKLLVPTAVATDEKVIEFLGGGWW